MTTINNDNCWWDAATDDQRREFTRQMIGLAKIFHEHDDQRLKQMQIIKSGLFALQADIVAAGKLINPLAKQIGAELLRSVDEFLSFQHPKVDWQDRLKCVGDSHGS